MDMVDLMTRKPPKRTRYTSKAYRKYRSAYFAALMAHTIVSITNEPGYMRRYLAAIDGKAYPLPPTKEVPPPSKPLEYDRRITVWTPHPDW